MMKEEDTILRKVGKENVFHAPEGYLENLTSHIMSQLPEKDMQVSRMRKMSRWHRFRPFLYGAAVAMVAILLLIQVVPIFDREPSDRQASSSEISDTELGSEQYISTAMDNSMMDDYSLYVYLTDGNE